MYENFAYLYDELMDNVPYEKWADMLDEIIREEGISIPNSDSADTADAERNQVLDLCCGTGTLTELMYEKGYDMIGVDNSEDMLNVAYEKRDIKGSEILYLLQDIRELDLYSTVGTIYCLCDSINYITDPEDLFIVFSLVHNYLYTDGLFIFDFNTVHKYRDVIGDITIAENREDCSFIWENSYDDEENINEYDLTVFARDEEASNDEKVLFGRFEESHFQRGYELNELRELLEKAGFSIVSCFDEEAVEKSGYLSVKGSSFNEDMLNREAERIYIIARKG